MEQNQKFQPVQPYLLVDTIGYRQMESTIPEISHFYTYSLKKGDKVRIVPDGCNDLLVIYLTNRFDVFVSNEKMRYREVVAEDDCTVFGIRFMPGCLPKMLFRKEWRGNEEIFRFVPWNCADEQWKENMSGVNDFEEQIALFQEWYSSYEARDEVPKESMRIIRSEVDMILEKEGEIETEQWEKGVGHSLHEINKIFKHILGYAPRKLCKIVRFQKSLEELDYKQTLDMSGVDEALGVYESNV